MTAPKLFYLYLKHVHKHGSAKFQHNPLFSSQQMATESAAEETKKSASPWGIPSNELIKNRNSSVARAWHWLSHTYYIGLFQILVVGCPWPNNLFFKKGFRIFTNIFNFP